MLFDYLVKRKVIPQIELTTLMKELSIYNESKNIVNQALNTLYPDLKVNISESIEENDLTFILEARIIS